VSCYDDGRNEASVEQISAKPNNSLSVMKKLTLAFVYWLFFAKIFLKPFKLNFGHDVNWQFVIISIRCVPSFAT